MVPAVRLLGEDGMALVLFVDTARQEWELKTRHYRVEPEHIHLLARALETDLLFCHGTEDGGRRYFAAARLSGVLAPERGAPHYRARVSDLVLFAPWPRHEQGTRDKRFPAVRLESLADSEGSKLLRRAGLDHDAGTAGHLQQKGLAEMQQALYAPERAGIVRRPEADPSAAAAGSAYGWRCAFSGLSPLSPSGGRSACVAVGIAGRPVSGAPAAELLWLLPEFAFYYEQHLLSVAEDYRIDVWDEKLPEPLLALLNPSGRINLPEDPGHRPDRALLRAHWSAFLDRRGG